MSPLATLPKRSQHSAWSRRRVAARAPTVQLIAAVVPTTTTASSAVAVPYTPLASRAGVTVTATPVMDQRCLDDSCVNSAFGFASPTLDRASASPVGSVNSAILLQQRVATVVDAAIMGAESGALGAGAGVDMDEDPCVPEGTTFSVALQPYGHQWDQVRHRLCCRCVRV